MSSRQCWTSGTTRRASLTRSALMTGISIFFDNKHQRPMEGGIWFHFGRQERNADASESHVRSQWNGRARCFKTPYSTATFVPF